MTDTDPTKNHETLNGTFPEASPERQATFEQRDFDRIYQLLCGDERKLSKGSAEELGSETNEVESFLRYFGGLAGGDASDIEQQRLGDPQEAIAYLKTVQQELELGLAT